MNFVPYSGHIPTANMLPTIPQFVTKLGYDNDSNGNENSPGVLQETRYHNVGNNVQFAVSPVSGQVTVDGVKYRQAESVVVVSAAQPGTVTLAGLAPIQVGQYQRKKLPSFEISFDKDMGKCIEVENGFAVNAGVKYQTISSPINLGNIAYGAAGQTSYVQAEPAHQMKADQRTEKRDFREELHQDLVATMMQQHQVTQAPLQQGQQLLVVLHEPKDAAAIARAIKQDGRQDRQPTHEFISIGDVTDSSTWQTITGSGVTEYLTALPLPLHQLLKYAPAEGKRDDQTIVTAINANVPVTTTTEVPAESVVVQTATDTTLEDDEDMDDVDDPNNSPPAVVKNKKKNPSWRSKRERPQPGEIRLTTALGLRGLYNADGSTLYCCPHCHMAYPERGLLQQHLTGHTLERRFICDICNAALKRKDHLTRHKQSHNSERPFVCSVCHKAFKRKEQLTLHFVIHSGEKRHVCDECGKGFYRKDHLRKHSRSHIARRVRAEMSQQGADSPPLSAAPAPAPVPTPNPS